MRSNLTLAGWIVARALAGSFAFAALAVADCPIGPERLMAAPAQAGIVADFDSDGLPDALVTTSFDDFTLDLWATHNPGGDPPRLLNLGWAGSVPSRDFAFVGAGEVDGVNGLDAAIFTRGAVALFVNRGDGTFDQVASPPMTPMPLSGELADLDADGLADLVFVRADETVAIAWNDAGMLGAPVQVAAGWRVMTVGDVSCDGLPDLVFATAASSVIGVSCNIGGRAFAPEIPWSAGPGVVEVVVADMSGDGVRDVAWASAATVGVLLGDGAGGLSASTSTPVSERASRLAAADLDGDGASDLALSNWSKPALVLLSDRSGGFRNVEALQQGFGDVAPVDYDGDGTIDIVGSDWATVWVHRNPGDGVFLPWGTHVVEAGSLGCAAGDVDADGAVDIVVGHAFTDRIGVLRGNGDGTFEPEVVHDAPGPAAIVVADLDGRFGLDVATDGDGVSVLLSGPGGTFGPPRMLASTGGFIHAPCHVLAEEMDGRPGRDLVAEIGSDVGVFANDGAGSFREIARTSISRNIDGLGVGDLDGDGMSDVAVHSAWWGSVSILLNAGDGTLLAPTEIFLSACRESCWTARGGLAILDADLDGDRDVVVVADRSVLSSVIVLFNDGTGTFPRIDTTEADTHWPSVLTTADIDDNGTVDLVLGGVGLSIDGTWLHILRGRGDGTFAPAERRVLGSQPYGIAVADVDGTGWPNIVACAETDPLVFVTRECHSPADLARSAAVTSLHPVTPPLASLFVAGGLDFLGLDGVSGPGEGDDDDFYIASFETGDVDPDPTVGDGTKPLVFYQVSTPGPTLRVRKSPQGLVRLVF